jgi:hypothetical protein
MNPFFLVLLGAAASVFGDLSGLVADHLGPSLTRNRVNALWENRKPVLVLSGLEYNNLYNYRNESELLPDSSYGPVEQRVALGNWFADLYLHSPHVSLGFNFRDDRLLARADYGVLPVQAYSLERRLTDANLGALFSAGPFYAGGGFNPLAGGRYLFAAATAWNITVRYIHDELANPFAVMLNPVSRARDIPFFFAQKTNHYEAEYGNRSVSAVLGYSVFSLLADSARHSDDGLSSLAYFSGQVFNAGFQAHLRRIHPRFSGRFFQSGGFYTGYCQSVPYGAFNDISVRGGRLEAGADFPFGIAAGYEYRSGEAASPSGHLEAIPFNGWNFLSHTYFKLSDQQIRCRDHFFFAGKTLHFPAQSLRVSAVAGYDWLRASGGFRYKEREFLLFFFPSYGENKTYALEDLTGHFLYLKLALGWQRGNFRLRAGLEQFIPLFQLAPEPEISGGTTVTLGLEFSVPQKAK